MRWLQLRHLFFLHKKKEMFCRQRKTCIFVKEKTISMATFEEIGYFVDYKVEGKYKGSINIDAPDRDTYGYYGRKTETLTEKITLSNGKVIKAGTVVVTELFPLNGKIDDNFKMQPNVVTTK